METKQFIEKFIKEREEWKVQEKARIEEENRKIAEYGRQQSQREESRKEAKRQADAARNAIYDKLSAEMADKEKARMELEDLRIDLYAQEEDERLNMKEKVLSKVSSSNANVYAGKNRKAHPSTSRTDRSLSPTSRRQTATSREGKGRGREVPRKGLT